MTDPDALARAITVARNRHQDAALRAARLMAQAKDATTYAHQLEREYYQAQHPPISLADVTPKERHDLLTALHAALEILDTGEDG